jgi:hypothetical protein
MSGLACRARGRPPPTAIPPWHAGSAEVAAVVVRIAPTVLGHLADGVPLPGAAIVAALARRHAKRDVVRASCASRSPAGWSRQAVRAGAGAPLRRRRVRRAGPTGPWRRRPFR